MNSSPTLRMLGKAIKYESDEGSMISNVPSSVAMNDTTSQITINNQQTISTEDLLSTLSKLTEKGHKDNAAEEILSFEQPRKVKENIEEKPNLKKVWKDYTDHVLLSSSLGKKVNKNEIKLKQYTDALLNELQNKMENTSIEIKELVKSLEEKEIESFERIDRKRKEIDVAKALLEKEENILNSQRAEAQRLHVQRMAELASFATKIKQRVGEVEDLEATCREIPLSIDAVEKQAQDHISKLLQAIQQKDSEITNLKKLIEKDSINK